MLQKLTDDKIRGALDYGIKRFASAGFDRVSMKDIAEDAGISVGVLYKYYHNKEDFFYACLDVCLDVLQDTLDSIQAESGSTIDHLNHLLHNLIQFSKEHPDEIKLYHEITGSGYSENAVELVDRVELITAAFYSEIIKGLQMEGKIRNDIDSHFAAFFIDNILVSLQLSYSIPYYKERMKLYVSPDCFENDDLMIEQLLKLLESAFRK